MEWKDILEINIHRFNRSQLIVLIDTNRKYDRYITRVMYYCEFGYKDKNNGTGQPMWSDNLTHETKLSLKWKILKWMDIPDVPEEYEKLNEYKC
jgi:hypothetical protein